MVEQESYKRAFDTINSGKEITVDSLMQRKRAIQRGKMRKALYTAALFSFLFVGSNVATYAKSGEAWISKMLHVKTGNGIEISLKEIEHEDPLISESEIIINTNDQNEEYCSVENGRLYFTLGDQKIDITDQCSESDYYRHEFTDEDGMRHVIAVGGGIDNPGWEEYIFDANGEKVFAFSIADLTGEGEQTPNINIVSQRQTMTEADEDGDNNVIYDFAFTEGDDNSVLQEGEIPAWKTKARADLGVK